MNDSGQAVAPLLRYYKLPPEALLVISDHLDLEFGKVRYRFNSSSGGQRGLQSIIQQLGTQAFGQLRLGDWAPAGTDGSRRLRATTLQRGAGTHRLGNVARSA